MSIIFSRPDQRQLSTVLLNTCCRKFYVVVVVALFTLVWRANVAEATLGGRGKLQLLSKGSKPWPWSGICKLLSGVIDLSERGQYSIPKAARKLKAASPAMTHAMTTARFPLLLSPDVCFFSGIPLRFIFGNDCICAQMLVECLQ